jgi:hypothetical protein
LVWEDLKDERGGECPGDRRRSLKGARVAGNRGKGAKARAGAERKVRMASDSSPRVGSGRTAVERGESARLV